MSLMSNIQDLIEEEVDNRVNQKISVVIEHISKKWDISLALLLKDVSEIMTRETNVTQCLGYQKKTKKRCKNKPQQNGFCHMHQSQVPKRTSPKPNMTEQHTHTLPPFYLKGCPVCDKSHKFKNFVDDYLEI